MQIYYEKRNRIIYTICFIVLNFIDWLQNTQDGDISILASNCIGLVMMVIVMSSYPIKELVTKFSYIWTLLCLGIMVLAALKVDPEGPKAVFGIYFPAFEVAVINAWWIGIMVYHLFKKIRTDKALKLCPNLQGWLWIILMALMIFSASGRVWPILYLGSFGIFYITKFSRKSMNSLMEGMLDGTVISFFMLQIFAYGFRPYDQVRYCGAYQNCNMAALHYLIVYTMVLMKLHILHQKKANIWLKIFYFIGSAGLCGFMFMTMGRTSWIAAAVITVLYGVLVVRHLWQLKWRTVCLRGAALCLAAVILFPVVFMTVRWLPTILHHPIWFHGEYSVEKVHSFDPSDSYKYIELNEFLDVVILRITGTFQAEIENPFVMKVMAAEVDTRSIANQSSRLNLDEGLSRRLVLYETYLDNLTWNGNAKEVIYTINGVTERSWHAHNAWLQVAYTFGIPAGILFIVLTVLLLWKHYSVIRKRTGGVYAIIPLFLMLVFCIYGMMEWVCGFGQFVIFLLFFVQHPQIVTDGEVNGLEVDS